MAQRKTRPPLTKTRKQWAESRKGGVFKGTVLRYPAGVEDRYTQELLRLVRKMESDTKKQVIALFRGEAAREFFAEDASIASQSRVLTNKLGRRFQQLFDRKSKVMAERMVEGANKASTTSLHTSLKAMSGGLSLKTSVLTGPMKDSMSAMVAENVGLIKSIAQQHLQDVQGAVMRSIVSGNGLEDLIPALEKIGGITERRAKNIALDQTRKAYNGINRDRMQALGVKQFEWIHSGGGQVPRPDHVAMSGNVYDFANPPVIDERTGERGIPGMAINCRCQMAPVVSFGEEE